MFTIKEFFSKLGVGAQEGYKSGETPGRVTDWLEVGKGETTLRFRRGVDPRTDKTDKKPDFVIEEYNTPVEHRSAIVDAAIARRDVVFALESEGVPDAQGRVSIVEGVVYIRGEDGTYLALEPETSPGTRELHGTVRVGRRD